MLISKHNLIYYTYALPGFDIALAVDTAFGLTCNLNVFLLLLAVSEWSARNYKVFDFYYNLSQIYIV